MNFNFSRISVPMREEGKMTEPVELSHEYQKTELKTKERKSHYLALWKASDVTQSEFCRTHEIKLSTFNAWLKKENDMKKEVQKVQTDEQKQISKQAGCPNIEESSMALQFPNGCCLQFSSQLDIRRISTLVRELLCVWN